MSSKDSEAEILDVAIVGAGVSGLYSAWRLALAQPKRGGANFWHLHVDSEQVARDILQPKPDVPVFVCGEAYSHQQGWAEGALRTADEMHEILRNRTAFVARQLGSSRSLQHSVGRSQKHATHPWASRSSASGCRSRTRLLRRSSSTWV